MPINWKDPEVKDRLLASIIASFDGKINCQEVARIFGEGATYNAIENFLRVPKKLAKELKEGAVGREVPQSPAKHKTPKTPKTPNSNGIKSGRITKPKKNEKSGSPLKKELTWEDENFLDVSNPNIRLNTLNLDSDEYA